MANQHIREHAKNKKVFLWEIADAIGIAEATFLRKMRKELPEKQQAEILALIQKIAAQKVQEVE